VLFVKHAHPDKKLRNDSRIHILVTTFKHTGNVCQVLIEGQSSRNDRRIDLKQCISCNNRIRLQEFSIAIGFIDLSMKKFTCKPSI
jgi:hypothetical protein